MVAAKIHWTRYRIAERIVNSMAGNLLNLTGTRLRSFGCGVSIVESAQFDGLGHGSCNVNIWEGCGVGAGRCSNRKQQRTAAVLGSSARGQQWRYAEIGTRATMAASYSQPQVWM
ncbi:hypothetical protein NL676_032760 [Syzygium grande]|nr:hypothetical protein NL676_032760 [Syzygium grande]